jgi:hypothetical protein
MWYFILMMEATGTSETSVNFYQITQRITPENSHLNAVFHLDDGECKHL